MQATENTEETEEVQRYQAFFKIPGGKRKLLTQLKLSLPEDFFETEYTYIEPFLGAGSLFLEIGYQLGFKAAQGHHTSLDLGHEFRIADANPYIWNLWRLMRSAEKTEDLYDEFTRLAEQHSKEFFLKQRSLFNSKFPLPKNKKLSIEGCAKFLYLNKHCFNGLIRFNQKGEFNAPCGDYKKPQKIDLKNLFLIHFLFDGNKIMPRLSDFESFTRLSVEKAKKDNILVYFDPPYFPLSPTANFTSYNPKLFNLADQIRLKGLIDELTAAKVKVVLSNSSAEWVYENYSDYNIKEVKAARSINSKSSGRGKIKELIITNF